MADKKKDVLSESDTQRNAWKKAEKLINQNKPEDALLILREFDETALTKPHFDLQVRQPTKSPSRQIPNPIIAKLLPYFETQ